MKADVTQIVNLAVDLARIADDVPRRSSLVVRKSSTDLERQMKARAAVDTGYLKSSIGTDFGTEGNLTYGDTGPAADYGAHVEFGTRNMAPQPYAMPAADAVGPNFIAAVEAVMKL